jgi:hypothetical protein
MYIESLIHKVSKPTSRVMNMNIKVLEETYLWKDEEIDEVKPFVNNCERNEYNDKILLMGERNSEEFEWKGIKIHERGE